MALKDSTLLSQDNQLTLPIGRTMTCAELPTQLWVHNELKTIRPTKLASYLGFVGNFDSQVEKTKTAFLIKFLTIMLKDLKASWPNVLLGFMANISEGASLLMLHHVLSPDFIDSIIALNPLPINAPLPLESQQWASSLITTSNQNNMPYYLVSEERRLARILSPEEIPAYKEHQRVKALRLIAALNDVLFVANVTDFNDATWLAITMARTAKRPVFFIDDQVNISMGTMLTNMGCRPVRQPEEMVSILKKLRNGKK
jgi:hypothetical protein